MQLRVPVVVAVVSDQAKCILACCLVCTTCDVCARMMKSRLKVYEGRCLCDGLTCALRSGTRREAWN
jgi:hypothetical protein